MAHLAINHSAPRALLVRDTINVDLTPTEFHWLIQAIEARAEFARDNADQVDYADFLGRRIAELRDASR